MNESLVFLSESLIRSFLGKTQQLARKTEEQIPSPAFQIRCSIINGNNITLKKTMYITVERQYKHYSIVQPQTKLVQYQTLTNEGARERNQGQ